MKISNFKDIDPQSISNIIFDWGGVITELDFEGMNKNFADLGIENFRNFFSKYEQKDFLKDFEMGKISAEEFRTEASKYCKEGTSFAQIDNAWNSILGVTPASRISLLKQLKAKYKLYLLSNTNEIHTNYYNAVLQKQFKVDHFQLFDKVFYSHDMALRKPGIEIYRELVDQLDMHPDKTLFIDDTEVNIPSAVELGIHSYHLNSDQDIAVLFADWV